MISLSPHKLLEIGVLNKQYPKYLFKYRTIEAAKKLLENNSMWFSSPKDFNDPFDCQIVPETNNTEKEIRTFVLNNTKGKLSNSQANDLVSKALKNPNNWKKVIEQTFDKVLNSTGICCFAKSERNILMWSHYTDSHKGVCLKFDILKDPEFFQIPLPVNYRNDYPKYNHLTGNKTLVHDMVLSKSRAWQYEDEIRVIKMNQNGLIPFNKACLSGIIFGCNTSKNEIDEIIKLSKLKGYKITFCKAEKSAQKYALDVKKI